MKKGISPGPSSGGHRGLNLRVKVTLSVILPLMIILGTFMVFQYKTAQVRMMDNLSLLASQTGLTIENSLQQAMLDHNQEELQHILDSIGENKMLRGVYLLDTSGRIVFAPNGQGVGAQLDNRDPTCQPCHHLAPSDRPSSVVVTLPGGQRVFRTMNPIRNRPECEGCHSPSQRLNGVLLTDISMAPLEASLTTDMWQHLLWWLAALLTSAIVVNLVLNRVVLSRLGKLSVAITKMGLGQLTAPLPENQPDEIGQLSLAFNQMVARVDAREIEIRQLSDDLQRQNAERGELLKRLITAQEDERKRVARELHDELGQALAALALRIETVKRMISSKPDQAKSLLEETQSLVNDSSERMYGLILALRPSVLDDLGLEAALRSQADRLLSNTSIAFELDAKHLTRRLAPEIETGLYRIFQEALINIVRHADAHRVSIRLAQMDGWFHGEIEDDGRGFDPQGIQPGADNPKGLGLMGMQERVAQLGGRLEISSQVGHGTHISIQVPLKGISYD